MKKKCVAWAVVWGFYFLLFFTMWNLNVCQNFSHAIKSNSLKLVWATGLLLLTALSEKTLRPYLFTLSQSQHRSLLGFILQLMARFQVTGTWEICTIDCREIWCLYQEMVFWEYKKVRSATSTIFLHTDIEFTANVMSYSFTIQ